MLHAQQIEELIDVVTGLDRPALIAQFHSFQGSFPVDFTPEFLETLNLDRLRHLLVALCLQQQRLPNPIAAELV